MLFVLLFVIAAIPLADTVFGLKLLQEPADNLVVAVAVIAWALAASILWRVAPLERLWRYFRS